MITFTQYVAECLQHVQDGLIMESEMAAKIAAAANGEMSFCAKPTSDHKALGLDEPAKD
jgi:hypothetical protein